MIGGNKRALAIVVRALQDNFVRLSLREISIDSRQDGKSLILLDVINNEENTNLMQGSLDVTLLRSFQPLETICENRKGTCGAKNSVLSSYQRRRRCLTPPDVANNLVTLITALLNALKALLSANPLAS